MIGIKLPKLRYAEESDGAVAADVLPSLLPYNAFTTADYNGLTNNLLSFQIFSTNSGITPVLSGIA